MAVGDYIICEPLRVWNRLEPRARRDDFSQALRAEIADPAWMLGRQWQFGELRGEDTGSPVVVKVATRSGSIESVRSPGGGFVPHEPSRPLEATVERQPFSVDVRLRAELGRQLLAVLADRSARHNESSSQPPFDPAGIRQSLRTLYGFAQPPSVVGTSPVARAEHIRTQLSEDVLACAQALAGRGVDGWAVLQALPSGTLSGSTLPGALVAGVHPAHLPLWVETLEAFRTWYRATYGDPTPSCWVKTQLEYSFQVDVPRPGGGSLVLKVPEYHGGRLDWDAFEQGPATVGSGGPDRLTRRTAQMIPAPAEFPGMPHPRFWQLEDGAVNLGDLRADTTDVVKVVVAEFALLFGNDWFVFPLSHPVGSLVEVEGLVVTDVFGQRTLVEPATPPNDGGWARWAFFELTGDAAASLGAHLFIPPVVGDLQESEPVEAVSLLRDESANMVWAIERVLGDGLGGGCDGGELARRFERRLRVESPVPTPGSSTSTATLVYQLGTGVPEHWIPFTPVHQPRQDRAVRLQRASMPRFAFDAVRPVRPQTEILRPGLRSDDSQVAPYFIHEEEVPRSGVRVESTIQRARWFDGSTHLWLGRRKLSGRGEGSSSLTFDVLRQRPKS